MIKLSVSIDVSNIKQAENFYIEALGCKKLRDQGGMSVISVENCDIYLQEKEARSVAVPTETVERNYSRHWTPVHIDFLAENVDEIVKRIVKLGESMKAEKEVTGVLLHIAQILLVMGFV
ncbi:VOC family protein [Microbulbifer sp. TRSA002]|uniref:VOC family protein n=1 Tax=Microbulbifer sp. TRSA002 TaxID=3243382 RepID=UPI004039FEEB